jgi:hypothetical protein
VSDSQRNFLILIAIAALGVMFSGVFALTAGTISIIVSFLFIAATIAFLIIQYQRNSGTISLMKPRYRLQLQASGIVLLIVIVTGLGVPPFLRGWSGISGLHTIAFFGLLAASIYGLYHAWRNRYS